jgi:hypothetical protein
LARAICCRSPVMSILFGFALYYIAERGERRIGDPDARVVRGRHASSFM